MVFPWEYVMRLAVIGSRNLTDYGLVTTVLDRYLAQYPQLSIVSGGAIGADSLGARYAKEHGLECLVFLPDWKQYGKRAGFLRNTTIWDNADAGVAFWDGVSKGTAHSFQIAASQHKRLEVVEFVPATFLYTT
jgi:hypothetical protein